ncbi:hypothetical protein MHU86_18135 [Fragilaria crotonensis]|nr:hypothetical protein MHU86_18135 [Fragilaria crotonensis]
MNGSAAISDEVRSGEGVGDGDVVSYRWGRKATTVPLHPYDRRPARMQWRAEHHKIYRSGIRAVTDDPFPCDADRLFQFLREVQDRAMEMGWMDGILNVTTNPGEEVPDEENMLENYGTITLEQVIESERTYIGSQVRKAQDTYMLYQCLMASPNKRGEEEGHDLGRSVPGRDRWRQVQQWSGPLEDCDSRESLRSLLRGFETSLLSLPSSFGIARCPPLDLVLMHECAATDNAESGVLALPGTSSRR